MRAIDFSSDLGRVLADSKYTPPAAVQLSQRQDLLADGGLVGRRGAKRIVQPRPQIAIGEQVHAQQRHQVRQRPAKARLELHVAQQQYGDKCAPHLDFDRIRRGAHEGFCILDSSIVRGLAYYTGIVFEVHDIVGELRAIGGGGRFDNLLHDFGGPKISATGMGMGDCVLEILLREKGLLDKNLPAKTLDYFVLPVIEEFLNEAVKITAQLRTRGYKTVFTYKSGSLSKQLKSASEQKAKFCVIIGDEFKEGKISLKNMSTSKQDTILLKDFLENPAKY